MLYTIRQQVLYFCYNKAQKNTEKKFGVAYFEFQC